MRDQDELLRRYLLGELEEEEQSRLEERLIREEELFEEMEAVESDLLDDYARYRLAAAERGQVEQRLLATPRGRLRLELVRGLDEIANEGRVVPIRPARRELSRFEQVAAIAAMLVIAILGFLVANQRMEPVRPRIVVVPPSPGETPAPRVPGIEIPPQREEEEKIVEVTPTPLPAPPPSPAALVIQLALSTFRGPGEAPAGETPAGEIPIENVPPGTERVELHLQLEEGDRTGYTSFEATVKGAGSELRRENLEAKEIEGEWILVLELDPKKLPEGMYEVEVWGVTDSGLKDHVASKQLEITRTRNDSAPAATPH